MYKMKAMLHNIHWESAPGAESLRILYVVYLYAVYAF